MKLYRAALPFVFALLLAACAPSVEPQPIPGAPPVIYEGGFNAVYGEVLLAIATADGLPESNGWIIDNSDLQGGFVETATFIDAAEDSTETLVVSLYPVGDSRTGIIIQQTPGAVGLGERISNSLSARFGEPVATERPQTPAAPAAPAEGE